MTQPLSVTRAAQPLPSPSDWTFDLIETYHAEIANTARSFGLDVYPNQLEVITAEQMMDANARAAEHSWREALAFLAQATGRLIRTSSDHGVVAVLDRRGPLGHITVTALANARRPVDFERVEYTDDGGRRVRD